MYVQNGFFYNAITTRCQTNNKINDRYDYLYNEQCPNTLPTDTFAEPDSRLPRLNVDPTNPFSRISRGC